MQNSESWNNPISETGSGKLLPPGDDGQQMPLNLGGGDEFNPGLIDAPGLDGSRKGVPGLALVLVIILAVGGGTLWAMRMTGSSAAPADETAASAELKIDEALKKLAAAGPEGSNLARGSIEALFQDADQVVSLFANDPVKNQVAVEELAKNPFALPEADESPKEAAPDVAALNRQARLKQLQEELTELKVQSVLTGSKSLAVVSGKVVRVGDKIGSFTVKAIAANGLTLTAEGQSFDLALAPRGVKSD